MLRDYFAFDALCISLEETFATSSSLSLAAQWSLLRLARGRLTSPAATASHAANEADLRVRIRQFAISQKIAAAELDDAAAGPALLAVLRSDVNRALYVILASRLHMDGEDGWRTVIGALERAGRTDGCGLLKLVFDDSRKVNALQTSTAIATAQHGANEIHEKGFSAIGHVVASLQPLAERFSFSETSTSRVFATMIMSSYAAVTPAEVKMRNDVLSDAPEFDLAYIEKCVQDVRAIAPIAPLPPYLAAIAKQLPAGNAAPRPSAGSPLAPGSKKQTTRKPWKELSATIPEGSFIDRSTGFLKCIQCQGDSGWNHHKFCKKASPSQQQQQQRNAPQAFPAAAGLVPPPAPAAAAAGIAAGAAAPPLDPAVAALMGDFVAALAQLGGGQVCLE